jgi:hypothetical protein
MFDCLYIASLYAHYLLIVYKVHMYCTSKQIDVLEMDLWSSIKYEFIYQSKTQFIKIVEDCPKALVRIPVWGKGKSGKFLGWEQVPYTNKLSKILVWL